MNNIKKNFYFLALGISIELVSIFSTEACFFIGLFFTSESLTPCNFLLSEIDFSISDVQVRATLSVGNWKFKIGSTVPDGKSKITFSFIVFIFELTNSYFKLFFWNPSLKESTIKSLNKWISHFLAFTFAFPSFTNFLWGWIKDFL